MWQVWKERNRKEFENQCRCPPVKTIDKAQKEWLEQEELERTKDRMSTVETAINHAEHHQDHEDEGTTVLEVTTTSQQRQLLLGIGAIAKIYPHTRIAE